MARPRKFDEEEALKAAMGVFWRHGYDATTYKMLSEATGVDVKGLSNVFGSKEEFFDKVTEAYHAMARGNVSMMFQEPSVDAIIAFFKRMRQAPASEDDPSNFGCLFVNTIFELQRIQPNIRKRVDAYREMWLDVFGRSLRASNIPNASERAEFLVGALWGALSEIRLARTKTAAAPLMAIAIETVEQWRKEVE